MEHFKLHSQDEQSNEHRDGVRRAVSGRRTFELDGETYEEVSFLYEPMERYQNDLALLDIVIAHKKRALQDTEETLAAHGTTPPVSELHLSKGDIAERIAFLKREVERFEVTRMMTLQRLALVARQDQIEKDLIDGLSADIEH